MQIVKKHNRIDKRAVDTHKTITIVCFSSDYSNWQAKKQKIKAKVNSRYSAVLDILKQKFQNIAMFKETEETYIFYFLTHKQRHIEGESA